jgi:hypothetical protein
MNLANRPPLGLKQPKAKKDPKHLARVAELPCCICEAFGEVQQSPTQVHHTFSERWGTDKTPDIEAIPLCEGHHLGHLDRSKLAIHANKTSWVLHYGADHEYIEATLDKLGV